jgi:hypothetical protein
MVVGTKTNLTLACIWHYNVGMRRWLAVAALGAALLTLPAWGQRRGGASGGFGGHAGFSGGHSVVSGRGSMMSFRSSAGVQRGGVHFVTGFSHSGSPFFFHHRHRFFPYGGYYGFYSYPWYYGNDSYSADSYQSYPPYDYSAAYVDNNREQAEIDRLENEVNRLREEREAREPQASSASQARAKSVSQPTQLVFRDKHTEARKIPIALLDIPATQKANEERGVDLQLPD